MLTQHRVVLNESVENNSIRLLDSPKQTRALLSIRPPYAKAILCGEKRYEFRRHIFTREVNTVLIYVTTPVQRVVAEFEVLSVLHEPLSLLWERTKDYAGIEEELFYKYFEGLEFGYAIEIGTVLTYDTPYCPTERLGVKPPQSFLYVD